MNDNKNEHWDGRAPFQQFGYELDKEDQERFKEFCSIQGIRYDSESGSSDSDLTENDDTNEYKSDDEKGLSYDVIHNPPLLDRKSYNYPLSDKDFRFNLFSAGDNRAIFKEMANFSNGSKLSGRSKIPEKVLEIIFANRKDKDLAVKDAIKKTFRLECRVVGLDASIKVVSVEVKVPGNLPLAVLYDRVLCPLFGWTRGYHDFAFIVHPSGYKDCPPANPNNDVVFGATTKGLPQITPQGFYATLRDLYPLRIDDSVVCLADLLQNPGHEIYHVLSLPGWKTKIRLKSILERKVDSPKLVRGYGKLLPENIILDFGEHDFSGPHAYALAMEMIKLSECHEKNGWMKAEAERAIERGYGKGHSDGNDGKSVKSFDFNEALKALKRAWKSTTIPNPEHSTDWLMMIMQSKLRIADVLRITDEDRINGKCQNCNVTEEGFKGKKLFTCTRCKNVFYCGKDCQKADWKFHRQVCIPSIKNKK